MTTVAPKPIVTRPWPVRQEPRSNMSGGDNAFASLIAEYIAESLPLAEQAADTFISLERRWRRGEDGSEAFGPLHGVLHTVKGNSAMMGLTPIQTLAHALEDLCGSLSRHPELRLPAADLLVEGGGLLERKEVAGIF